MLELDVQCVSSSRQRSSWNIHVNRISPALSLQNSREEASESKVWHHAASYSSMHGFNSLDSYLEKSLPQGSKKQLFITFVMGLINLCDLRKAAELEGNLNSVMQLQVPHEIEVPVHAPRICPPVLSSWGLGQVFHLTVLSSSQWGHWGTVEIVTLQVLSVAILQALCHSQARCSSFTKVLSKAWHRLKHP